MTYNSFISNSVLSSTDFINLKNLLLAEFEIIFRVNLGYEFKKIEDVKLKEQLLFQRFKNKNQQLNLMLIDSVFPLILADMALLALLKRISNFNDYISSKDRIIFPQIVNDKIYFERKFTDFLNALLYGNVSKEVIWDGDTDNNRVFCFKNQMGELVYYSIFERKCLLDLLFSNLKVIIIETEWLNSKNEEFKLKFSLKLNLF